MKKGFAAFIAILMVLFMTNGLAAGKLSVFEKTELSKHVDKLCEYMINEGSLLCWNCGDDLSKQIHNQVRTARDFCEKCGAFYQLHIDYCPECGSDLTVQSSFNSENDTHTCQKCGRTWYIYCDECPFCYANLAVQEGYDPDAASGVCASCGREWYYSTWYEKMK